MYRPLATWDCFRDSNIGPVAIFVQNISHSPRVMEADSSPTYGIFLSDGLGSCSAILVTLSKGDETSAPNIGVTRL